MGNRILRGEAIAFALVLVAMLALPVGAPASVDETVLASRAPGGGPGADGLALRPSISDDGCRIAFDSSATNLVSGEDESVLNVFVRDVCTDTTVLASVTAGGLPAHEDSVNPVISGNGCRVAFSSSGQLTPGADSDGNVFVRDVCEPATILASVDKYECAVTGISSADPGINVDGTKVAFTANQNMTPVLGHVPDTNAVDDVYVRDVDGGTTRLVSVNLAGSASGNAASSLGSVGGRNSSSDSGRYVSFASAATNLTAGDTTAAADDIFVRDVDAATTVRANLTDADSELTTGSTSEWAISGDGRRIAFVSNSPQLPGGSPSGQVYLRDLDSAATELVSRASGPDGDPSVGSVPVDLTGYPALDETGRMVAFVSTRANLVTGAAPITGRAEIFVRDMLNGTTFVASRESGALGALSNGDNAVTRPGGFSDDGRFLAFGADTPLAPGASGVQAGVYRRELAEPSAATTGQTFNARPVQGSVLVRPPGSTLFRPLEHAEQLPFGTTFDTRGGRVAITTTGNTQSKPVQTAEFFGGVFNVAQDATTLVTMRLAGKRGCGRKQSKGKKGAASSGAGPLANAAARGRGLWGSGRGRFGTRGGRGAGTVRGTTWFVQDRCDGSTLFRVTEGTLAINDFGRKGALNKLLQAPGTYVAKPPRKKLALKK